MLLLQNYIQNWIIQETSRLICFSITRVEHLWIQDFPDWGRQPQKGGAFILFDQIFAENCMKLKEIRPRGDPGSASVKGHQYPKFSPK